MKLTLTTLFLLLLCSFAFSQQKIVLANETECDLNYRVYEVESGTCNTAKIHDVVVPSYSGYTLTAKFTGTEFNRAVMTFIVNNCVAMNLAAPNNTCVTCPITWLSSSYSFTPNCKNNCKGANFNLQWVDCLSTGSGVPHILVWM